MSLTVAAKAAKEPGDRSTKWAGPEGGEDGTGPRGSRERAPGAVPRPRAGWTRGAQTADNEGRRLSRMVTVSTTGRSGRGPAARRGPRGPVWAKDSPCEARVQGCGQHRVFVQATEPRERVWGHARSWREARLWGPGAPSDLGFPESQVGPSEGVIRRGTWYFLKDRASCSAENKP